MIATSKMCRKCGVEKDAQEFRADPRYRDGLDSYCKACKYVLSSKARDAWKLTHVDPVKDKARRDINVAIRSGRVVRGPCEIAGCPSKTQAHHDDYSKPLDVRWLCAKHHQQHHAMET